MRKDQLSWKFTITMTLVFAILLVFIWILPPMPERATFAPPLGEFLWVQGAVLYYILKSGLVSIPLAILVLLALTILGDNGNCRRNGKSIKFLEDAGKKE